jgi:hypothetical protein
MVTGIGCRHRRKKLLKLSLSMIDDVAKTVSEFMKEYKDRTRRQQRKCT